MIKLKLTPEEADNLNVDLGDLDPWRIYSTTPEVHFKLKKAIAEYHNPNQSMWPQIIVCALVISLTFVLLELL